jgi:hypothetical protein
MRRQVMTLMVAALVMGTALPAHATVVSSFRFKGIQVATSFFGSVPIDCGGGATGEFSANGFISGGDQVFKIKGIDKIDGNAVVVDVFFSNSCTGESRFASGAVQNGLNPPNRKLEFASMEGSTFIQDFFDGAVFPFSLDVEVEGVGPISAGRSKSNTKTQDTPDGPITITHSDFANSNRSAIAIGTVTINGITLTPEFFLAGMNTNANSTLTVEAGHH